MGSCMYSPVLAVYVISLEIARFVLPCSVSEGGLGEQSQTMSLPREVSPLAEVINHATHDDKVSNHFRHKLGDSPGLWFESINVLWYIDSITRRHVRRCDATG
jgi:hypothetical protein